MVKRISTLLGLGLVALWLSGLVNSEASLWLTWFNGFAALAAFGIAAFVPPQAPRNTQRGLAVGLAGGLLGLFIVAIATDVVAWQAGWTFAFSCAFLVLGITASPERRAPLSSVSEVPRSNKEFEDNEFEDEKKRSA